jgi:hypothetical protein
VWDNYTCMYTRTCKHMHTQIHTFMKKIHFHSTYLLVHILAMSVFFPVPNEVNRLKLQN